MSYFGGGSEAEDHGFALQPWSKVCFDNKGMKIDHHSAIDMGNYFFADAKTGKELKVDFTLGLKRASTDGHRKLFPQRSSPPYEPAH